jgi:hypothetical protein
MKELLPVSNARHLFQALLHHDLSTSLETAKSEVAIEVSVDEWNNGASKIISLEGVKSSRRQVLIGDEGLHSSNSGGDVVSVVDGPNADVLDQWASTGEVIREVIGSASPVAMARWADGDDVVSGSGGRV